MQKVSESSPPHRPLISNYADPVAFVRDMLQFRKKTERSFSVLSATKGLRRVSPALVTLILKKERSLTMDRADEFAKLLNLNLQEKSYFKFWLENKDPETGPSAPASNSQNRKDVGTHILNDWLNVYVKDCFQLPQVQKDPTLLYHQLALYASRKRIDRSLQFLLSQGHLRKTTDGHIVTDTPLALAQSTLPSKKIRQFHKNSLMIARSSLDLVPPTERLANTLILPLNAKSYQSLLDLIQEFAQKTQDFAAHNTEAGDRLYQLIVNLSPTGGKLE